MTSPAWVPEKRSLVELDAVIDEIIERNPAQYAALISEIQRLREQDAGQKASGDRE